MRNGTRVIVTGRGQYFMRVGKYVRVSESGRAVIDFGAEEVGSLALDQFRPLTRFSDIPVFGWLFR